MRRCLLLSYTLQYREGVWFSKMHLAQCRYYRSHRIGGYCSAHDGWNVTGYQGLFCPLNKPSCGRLPECVQMVKAGGRRVFVVENGPF